MGPNVIHIHTEGLGKILTNRLSLKLITVHDTVKSNVIGFNENSSSHGIQRYLLNDHA